jgi:hypothetical protein
MELLPSLSNSVVSGKELGEVGGWPDARCCFRGGLTGCRRRN